MDVWKVLRSASCSYLRDAKLLTRVQEVLHVPAALGHAELGLTTRAQC